MSTVFRLLTMDPKDFPQQPEIAPEFTDESPARVDAGVLRTLIERTEFAAAAEAAKFAYNGVPIVGNGTDKRVTFVATDGRRLAKATEDCEGLSALNCIVPGTTLRFLLDLINDDAEPVAIQTNGALIQFTFANSGARLSASLVEGKFPDYEDLLAKLGEGVNHTVEIARGEFLDAIGRASVMSNDDGAMSFTFMSRSLTLECISPDAGDSHFETPCKTVGGKITIGFKHKFVADFLKHCRDADAKSIRVTLQSRSKAGLFTASANYLYVVMPVDLNKTDGDDDATSAKNKSEPAPKALAADATGATADATEPATASA